MANLKQDCEDGTIDALVHMGDHVYFWEGADNRRGDAYMNAFQPTLSICPWIPLLGNHECVLTSSVVTIKIIADQFRQLSTA